MPNSDARYLPGRPGDDGAPVNQIITLPDSAPDGELTVGEYIDDYPYDVRAISDNRPFFWHFTPFSQVIKDIGEPLQDVDVEIGIGERVLLVLLGMSIFLAAVFLLVPFLLVRTTWRAPAQQGHQRTDLRPARPRLHRVRDHADPTLLPVPRLPDVLAHRHADGDPAVDGCRRARQRSLARAPDRMLAALAVAILGLGAFYIWISPLLEEALLGWPLAAKVIVVIALCAPLGFCLGMFMPLAISLVATDPEHSSEYVAWGWAINGFFSVIGSTLTTMVSMTYGFRVVLGISVVLYLVVILLMRRLAGLRMDGGSLTSAGIAADARSAGDRHGRNSPVTNRHASVG